MLSPAENVKSLWKAFVPRMVTLYFDQISEHQRDLTNSASMRFFNELPAALDYATRRLTSAIENTEFNLENIKANLEKSYAAIVAEPLYIALALAGHTNPYYVIREFVLESNKTKKGFPDHINTHADLKAFWEKVPDERKQAILDPATYIGDAPQRTLFVCDDAETRVTDLMIKDLQRPSEEKALVV
jgi:adenylosuccinate lyase